MAQGGAEFGLADPVLDAGAAAGWKHTAVEVLGIGMDPQPAGRGRPGGLGTRSRVSVYRSGSAPRGRT